MFCTCVLHKIPSPFDSSVSAPVDYSLSPAAVDNGVNPLEGAVSDDDGDSCSISCPLDFSDDSTDLESASEDEQDDDDEVSSQFTSSCVSDSTYIYSYWMM